MKQDLIKLERYSVEQLWQMASSMFSRELHAEYITLLHREREKSLTLAEKERLETLFESANRHMLQKAYANVLLKC